MDDIVRRIVEDLFFNNLLQKQELENLPTPVYICRL